LELFLFYLFFGRPFCSVFPSKSPLAQPDSFVHLAICLSQTLLNPVALQVQGIGVHPKFRNLAYGIGLDGEDGFKVPGLAYFPTADKSVLWWDTKRQR